MTIEGATNKLLEYGILGIVALALGYAAVVLFEKLESAQNQSSRIEIILSQQEERDRRADESRERANNDRAQNREILIRVASDLGDFRSIAEKRDTVDRYKEIFMMHALNKLLEIQGAAPVFPIENIDRLERTLIQHVEDVGIEVGKGDGSNRQREAQ